MMVMPCLQQLRSDAKSNSICTYFVFETRISPQSKCGNRISDANFITVFRGNYGSILLRFDNGTDDGPATANVTKYVQILIVLLYDFGIRSQVLSA